MNIAIIDQMRHSPLRNYAGIPGLTSWLIGAPGPRGLVRLFECERNHDEHIVPHSHRFDFECLVLEGEVRNVVYTADESVECDDFVMSLIDFGGRCGVYTRGRAKPVRARRKEATYVAGQVYSMQADEIHSIYFSKGAKVLFFEGPQIRASSVILEPVSGGEHIRTFCVKPWMFQAPAGDRP